MYKFTEKYANLKYLNTVNTDEIKELKRKHDVHDLELDEIQKSVQLNTDNIEKLETMQKQISSQLDGVCEELSKHYSMIENLSRLVRGLVDEDDNKAEIIDIEMEQTTKGSVTGSNMLSSFDNINSNNDETIINEHTNNVLTTFGTSGIFCMLYVFYCHNI